MANALVNEGLQNLGAGDLLALGLKMHADVLESFSAVTIAFNDSPIKAISSATSHQYIGIGTSLKSRRLPGEEYTYGGGPPREERLVVPDSKKDFAMDAVDEDKMSLQHYDEISQVVRETAAVVARAVDKDIFRMMILGANQNDRAVPTGQVFRGGTRLAAPRTGPITTAYPMTSTGSTNFQTDLSEIGRGLSNRNVPSRGVCYINSYMMDVLLKDPTLSSRDFTNANDLIQRRMTMAQGFMLVEVPDDQFPREDDTSNTNIDAPYRSDFSKTVAIFRASRDAVGSVVVGGTTIRRKGPEWLVDKGAWQVGAEIWKGSKWLRPEALGVITHT